MPVYLLAFLIGVVSGLRALTAPTAVSWGARLGWINLEGTSLAFLGHQISPYIFSVLALGEIVNDKLPKTPSRKAAGPFVARLVMGGLSGAAIGAARQNLVAGLIAGMVGAVVGTYGGYELRRSLAGLFGGNDLPAALIEDAIAVGGAFWIASHVS